MRAGVRAAYLSGACRVRRAVWGLLLGGAVDVRWSTYGEWFAENLRVARKNRGISQQVLADLAGVSRNQVYNLESNAGRVDPMLSTVYALAEALEVPPATLLPGVTAMAPGIIEEDEPGLLRADEVAPFSRDYLRHKLAEARRWAL